MKHIDYWTVSLASVDGKTRSASEVREPEDVRLVLTVLTVPKVPTQDSLPSSGPIKNASRRSGVVSDHHRATANEEHPNHIK